MLLLSHSQEISDGLRDRMEGLVHRANRFVRRTWVAEGLQEKEKGRITIWGKISLSGILLSSGLGVVAQLKESSDTAAKTLKGVRDIQRVLSPIESPELFFTFTMPCSEKDLKSFCEEVKQDELAPHPDNGHAELERKHWAHFPQNDHKLAVTLQMDIFADSKDAEGL